MKFKEIAELIYKEPESIKSAFELKHGSERILLLGTPHHGNLGDHLIAEAELEFFEKYLYNKKILDCTMRFSKALLDYFGDRCDKTDIIAISGGGWLGTEWRHNEEFVRRVIRKFEDNKIIMFPQTAFYINDPIYLREGAAVYRQHKSLLLCAREKATYNLFIDYEFAKPDRIIYMPDMALYSTLYESVIQNCRNHIGVCIRDDREANLDETKKTKIREVIKQFDPQYKTVSTNEHGNSIKAADRKKNLVRKLNEIASYNFHII